MAKTKDSGEDKPRGLFGGVPFGSLLDVFDKLGSFFVKFLASRYEIDRKVEQLKEDARETVHEIREEAVKTGYAVKKAFFRSIVEAIFLTTGLLALILGLILVVSDVVPLKFVLLGYGLIVTIVVLLKMKMAE